jgi:hypothetical protein
MSTPGGPYSDRRRTGRPWLAWLVILIVIGFIIWLIAAFAGGRGRETATPTTGAYPAAQEPVTNMAAIANAQDKEALVDRPVSLSGVTVANRVGDRGFFIESEGRRLFVQTPNPQVNEGDRVDVSGTLQSVPDNVQQSWTVDQETARALSDQGVYVQATKVQGA